jgi:hypothetical protein
MNAGEGVTTVFSSGRLSEGAEGGENTTAKASNVCRVRVLVLLRAWGSRALVRRRIGGACLVFRTSPDCQAGIQAGWNRMRTESQHHERLRFRQSGGSESGCFLKLAHSLARRIVPFTGGLFVQVPSFRQRLLDFPDSFRLQMKP